MKAMVCPRYGPPEVIGLGDVDKPTPGDREVLVRVVAATVNRTDCGILRAKPFFIRLVTGLSRPKIPIPGTEFAGRIEAVGPGVTRFQPGDRVFGFDDLGTGSHAEYLTLREDKGLGLIPDNTGFEQAAACLEGAHYARNFLNKVKLEAGLHVLVNGGTGAIGSAAVQLLADQGVWVTAVCRGEHFDLVRTLGASEVIDYTKDDFTRYGRVFDHVFDTVGKSTFGKCKPLLKPGGAYMSSELGPGAQNAYLPLLTKRRSRRVLFPFPTDIPETVALIRGLLEAGRYRAVIDRSYPLDQTVEAFRYVEQGQKVGSVVIQVADAQEA